MSLRRSLTAGVTLTSLLLLAAAPAGAATETTTRGTATTTTVPLHVEALDVPIDLGRTVLTATTDGDETQKAPWSSVALTLADIAGTRVGELSVASDDSTSSQGSSMERDTAVGAIAATAGDLVASADKAAGTATAEVSALTTEATVLNALGLSATITDVVAAVDDEAATARHTLAVAGIDLDLANLLGDVLSTLPLPDLLALADLLDVDVPVDLTSAGDVVTAVQDLLVAVSEADAAADDVEDAAAALLAADGGTLAALQDLLARAEGLDPNSDLTDELDGILNGSGGLTDILDGGGDGILGGGGDGILGGGGDGILGGGLDLGGALGAPNVAALSTDCVDLDLLDNVINCLEGEITAHVNGLLAEFGVLDGAVEEYLAAITAATDAANILESDSSSLGEIVGQIETLLDDLLAADLLAVGPIDVTQQVTAVGDDLEGSSASHTCQLTTIAALGAAPIEVANCDGGTDTLGATVDTVSTTLVGLLDVIGGVDAGNGVELELFGTVEDTVTEGEDGIVRATSVMEVLALTVPDVTITPCDVADGLGCALGLDLDDVLGDLDGVGGVLTAAQGTVTTALGTVTGLVAALDETLPTVPGIASPLATINDAIAALEAALDGLVDGLGDLGTGGGITVPGARIVVDPTLETEHQVVTAAADPGDPNNPANPAPGTSDPTGAPTLPNTGGGAALLAVLALGTGAWLFRRREVQ